MKKTITAFLILFSLTGFSQVINEDEYCARRGKVLAMMDSSSALVMKAVNSSSQLDYYKQNPGFYYLTGINSPSNYILMSPKGINIGNQVKTTIIFYSRIENVRDLYLSANDTLIDSKEFKTIFKSILPGVNKLYYSAPDIGISVDWLNDKAHFLDKNMKNSLKESNPDLKKIESADILIGKLRAIKSEQEIALIRKATDITSDGLLAAMKLAKPGIFEYELQAAIEYEFTRQGAMHKGFSSIVGSGNNSTIIHYSKNNRKTENGDLVVIDVGAEYYGYSSDITRTIPISGKFSAAQKEIYQMVLKVQKDCILKVKPGISLIELEKFAYNEIKKLGYEKYYTHGLSHPVGLQVHDVNTEPVLKPGMVITIEPGLYFDINDLSAPEKYRGYGVRIEDIILVTENGCEILSAKVTKEIDEIEKLMNRKK